ASRCRTSSERKIPAMSAERPPRTTGSGAIPVQDAPEEDTGTDDRTRPRARAPVAPQPERVSREGAIPSAPASRPSRAGVVPQGSHALQTRTQKVVASLQREWKYTLACVGTCLLLGATALWLGQLGHTVLAILVALVILPVSF